jgi:hypothetical protein
MPLFNRFVAWATLHWGLFALLCTVFGGAIVTWFLSRPKDRAQTLLADAQRAEIEDRRKQKEIDNRISDGRELLIIHARAARQREGVIRAYSEDELRANLKHNADLFSAIMNALKEKGEAKEIRPGWWSIDE